ncbi:MAG: hypothetical protein ACN4GW_20515 [Desulforhopalus sp.]
MYSTIILVILFSILPVVAITAYSAESTNIIEHEVEKRLAQGEKANRLVKEQSPYLLQHSFNPVDGYPWGEADSTLFMQHYGVLEEGNVRQDPMKEFTGRNILYKSTKNNGPKDLSQNIQAVLNRSKKTLFAKRQERSRPHLDDKVITSWNGMMVSALAQGSRLLNDPRLLDEAVITASFVREYLFDETSGTLLQIGYSSPTSLVLLADGDKNQSYLAERLSFLESVAPIDNKATAFVCSDFTCKLPVTDPVILRKQIRDQRVQ